MLHATVPCFMQSMLAPTVSCIMQPILDPLGAGSLEGTWVRGGCSVAPAGHAGRDGCLPGNTRFTYSFLIPVWTMVLTFALCLSDCTVTNIADGASFKRDVIWRHESAFVQLPSMACELTAVLLLLVWSGLDCVTNASWPCTQSKGLTFVYAIQRCCAGILFLWVSWQSTKQ